MPRLASSLLAVVAALAISSVVAKASFQVSRAVRKVDASKHVVTSSTAYKLSALPSDGVFRVAFSAEEAPYVSAVVARFEEGGSEDNAQPLVVKKDSAFVGDAKSAEGWSYFAVDLKGRKELGEKDEIVVDAVLTDALQPFPKEISQFERQMVAFSLSAYIASPYAVAKQSTTVALPSGGGSNVVESVDLDSSSGASYKQEGSQVKFGPFKSAVEAFTSAAAKIHYHNNYPFATFTTVHREVEVSMWGNVAVEEHYSLLHTGAALKHGFSRIDYQSKGAKANSFHELTALLPLNTLPNSVYYRDVIGNISTSAVRKDSRAGATVLEIEPRFPLFGGWKTVWHQGYSLPVAPYVSVVGNAGAASSTKGKKNAAAGHKTVVATNDKNERELELRVDALIPYKSSGSGNAALTVSSNALSAAASSYPVNEYTLKIILPEGATLLSVEAPFPHKLEESRRWTYLDSLYGRAVAVIRAEGKLVSAGINAGDVVVRYAYPASMIWVKPGVLVAALLAVFVSITFLSRVDLSLGGRTGAAAQHEKKE